MKLPFKKTPVALAVAAAFGAVDASAQTTLVSEFQVNAGSPTLLPQPTVDVASAANGTFIAVWDAFNDVGTGDEPGVRSRIHFADGTPFTPVTQVNTNILFNQDTPAVDMNANGDFVVVWADSNADGPYGGTGVYGQLFNNAGQTVGLEFQVPADNLNEEFAPDVAMADNGDFMVVWNEGIFGDVQARVFSSTLDVNSMPTPQTGDVIVSTDTTGNFAPAIGAASGATPRYVVAWTGQGTGDVDNGIFYQILDGGGQPVLPSNGLANTTTAFDQIDPSVAVDTNDFVIAWTGPDGGEGPPFDIFAQRFDTAGAPQGTEIRVNTVTAGDQGSPSAAMDPNGNFAVAWQGPDQDGNGVFYQRFDNQGNPVFPGVDTQINLTTAGAQEAVGIAMADNGEISAAWRGDDGAGGTQVFALRAGQGSAPAPSNPVDLVLEAVGDGKASMSPLTLVISALVGFLVWVRRFLVRR